MRSRIAQRSCKTAKKPAKGSSSTYRTPSTPQFICPKSCATLLTTPGSCFTGSTWEGSIFRRGNCLVYLKHDYLARFMPRGRFTAIRDALEEAEVISVRKFCVPGELCYGYRLCPPHDQGFFHYQPTTKRLIDKIMAWRAKEFRDVRLPLHRDLRRFVKAITIDEIAVLRSVQGAPSSDRHRSP